VEVTKNKGFTVNSLIVIALGTLFMLASIVVYLLILKGVMGRFSYKEAFTDVSSMKKAISGEGTSIAILYSQYTENMLPPGSTWLNDNITTWKKFLNNYHYSFDIIKDNDIEKGKHYNYKILILPGSKSLSDEETINIKKFIDRGGSVFVTSGIASFSADGKWRGWEFFNEVFGMKFIKEVERDDVTKIHTLRGNLPITANIPTGYPLKVATWDRPISVEVLEPRSTQVSFWYNYRLQDGLVREEVKKSGGIVYGSYGKGRFIWMGFEINSVIGIQEDYIYFDRLFHNALSWLQYKPLAYVKDWPEDYKAGAMLAVMVGDQPQNVRNILPLLRSEGIKATFFVDPSKVSNYQDLVKTIASYGDIGAVVDIGYMAAVDDTTNKLDDYNTQTRKVKEANSKIESIKGVHTDGLLPYYGLFDDNSLRAIAEANYKYVLTDSLTDRSVPKAIIKGENTVISITKTARDDYEVIRDFGLTQQDFQLYTYKEDVDRVLFEGGLYVFKVHTEFQCQPQNISVLRDLLKYIKTKKMWVASGNEIYNWWVKKNKVEMRIESRGESRVTVSISNPGMEKLKEIMLEIDLQMTVTNLEVSSEIIGTIQPEYSFNPTTHMMYLKIKEFTPGETRIYYIDYDKPKVLSGN
jgi:peptidoglycan/xylan/chitin deacetylase (PgdA/CDA1 family)